MCVAEHEAKLTTTFCEMASEKVKANLSDVKSNSKRDAEFVAIADDIFDNLKYVPTHPTGVNT